MIILILGIVIWLMLAVFFFQCYIRASVFPRIGFINDEVPIGKVELKKYYSVDSIDGWENEEREV